MNSICVSVITCKSLFPELWGCYTPYILRLAKGWSSNPEVTLPTGLQYFSTGSTSAGTSSTIAKTASSSVSIVSITISKICYNRTSTPTRLPPFDNNIWTGPIVFRFGIYSSHSFDNPEGCDGLVRAFLTLWEWIIRALSPGPGTSITVWGIKRVMEHRNSIRPMRKLTNSPNPSEISKVSAQQLQCTEKRFLLLLHFSWIPVSPSASNQTPPKHKRTQFKANIAPQ